MTERTDGDDAPPPVEESTPAAKDYAAAYAAALAPKPKIAEMVAVLNYFADQHNGSALAVAKVNGDAFDAAMLRRVAVLDAAMDLLNRIREKAPAWPANIQNVIRGPSSQGENRGR